MKVTVIFGETRVVVPCGQGDFLVSELIEKAVVRYRKAAGKTTDHYVHIHTLKSHSDGGILDLDDILSDVVDDRDQIIAEYEEHSGPSAPQGGDGTSGSSVGSVSPDAFQSNRKLIPPSSIPMKSGVVSQPAVLPHRSSPSVSTNSVRSSPALYIDTAADQRGERRHLPPPHALKAPYHMDASRDRPPTAGDKLGFSSSVGLRPPPDKVPVLNNNVDNRHSVEVTEQDLNAGTGLQVLSVRRDSEPNIVSALEMEESLPSVQKPWAHLPEPNPSMKPRHTVQGVSESSDDESGSTSPGFSRFNRDSSRQSLTGQNVLKWASAQERQQESHEQELPDETQALQIQTDMQKHGRREPLGQSQSPGEDRTQDTRLVVLKNEEGPLGIHVVPHRDEHNRESGLAIQGVEPGGRVHRTGQIAMRDVIVEINGRSLRHTNFIEAQEIFREALQTNDIRLRVHRPTPVRTSSTSSAQDSSAPVSPRGHMLFKSVPPPPPQRSPNTVLSNQSSVTSLPRHNQLSPNPVYQQPPDDAEPLQGVMQASSRKLGKKIYIELSKGPEGLGFSITTRDNPAGGLAPPIYVKNILPKGAAIVDGRLKSGDRLLEVNNTDMTGKSQNEVVAILRNTKRGSTVTLCVSRLDSGDSSSSLPRQMTVANVSVPCTPTTKRLLANALRYNSLYGVGIADSQDDTINQHRETSSSPKVTNEKAAQGSDKKVLTFNIPLNETGSAGLGISVKGKTAMIEGADKDLGIFIKAVIHGGAASKDGRLQINDQLLSVNGDDLKKKSNSEAMEALRKAMHTEGPTPGHIKLTVERKHSASVSSASTPEPWDLSTTDSTITGRTSTDGGVAALGNKIVEVTLTQHNERKLSTSEEPEQPVTSPQDQAVSQNVIDNMRNPVLDRLTGGSNKLSELCMPENESYHIATQEDSEGEESYEPPSFKSQSTIPNPVQSHTNSSSVMMIEGDNNEQMVLQQPIRIEEPKPKARPLSTIGGIGMAAAAEAREKRNSEMESEKRSVSPPPTGTPSGEESNMNTFDREAMGRRSFSEKRKASNGKNKEVVAKVKALREEMKLGTSTTQPSKEAGSERDAGHSGPYKFKPLTLDLSVTSAYQPVTPMSITELPSSPLYLQRTASHQHPPRPSLVSDSSTQPPRQRTLSTSSSSIGANGRRPVPAPRLSISSRPDADYQFVDSSMPDVQINDALPSSNGSASAKTFLYPEINNHANTKESAFSRASTLPVSAQRPQFDSQISRSRSKSPDDRARSGADGDVESANSLTGSLENKSPPRGNKKGNSSLMKRINSRTSLTDMEKSERRKSDLLESSPYPQLYNLAMEDSNSKSTAANNASDPIYSKINKLSGPRSRSNKPVDGIGANKAAHSFADQTNYNADSDSSSSSVQTEEDTNTPLNAGGPSSPIYERIGSLSSFTLDRWQASKGAQSNGFLPERVRANQRGEGHLARACSAESLCSNTADALVRATNAQPEVTGPNLGLKKNSSFESLQAMVEEAKKPSAETSFYKPPNRVSRGRGCNESFRAAVDRSYVPALSDQMDPDVKQTRRQRPRVHSASVNVDRDLQRKVSEENEFTNMRQAPMNASFSAGEADADKKKNKKTKNSGILGMFRFNKGRKSLEERQAKSPLKATKSEEKERSVSHSSSKTSQQDADSHYNVQEKIQDYYKKLQERQRTQGADSQQEYGTYPRGDRLRINPPASQPPPVPPHGNGNVDRADQLANIRAQHQRRHNERQGQYPNEDKEDFYERKIKERERELRRSHHSKSKSIDNTATASLEFFAAVNNRAYGTGAEFNPRHKSSQPSGMSSSALNRYSFYADPRYHDYHRSTQGSYHVPPPNDFNSNVSAQYPLPGGQRTAFTSRNDSYNNSLPKRTLPAGSSDYAAINKIGSKSDHQMSQSGHQRYPSYEANPPFQTGSAVRHDVIFDYDDPQGAENSLYARVRKAPTLSHTVTNPAQV